MAANITIVSRSVVPAVSCGGFSHTNPPRIHFLSWASHLSAVWRSCRGWRRGILNGFRAQSDSKPWEAAACESCRNGELSMTEFARQKKSFIGELLSYPETFKRLKCVVVAVQTEKEALILEVYLTPVAKTRYDSMCICYEHIWYNRCCVLPFPGSACTV